MKFKKQKEKTGEKMTYLKDFFWYSSSWQFAKCFPRLSDLVITPALVGEIIMTLSYWRSHCQWMTKLHLVTKYGTPKQSVKSTTETEVEMESKRGRKRRREGVKERRRENVLTNLLPSWKDGLHSPSTHKITFRDWSNPHASCFSTPSSSTPL